MPWCPSSVWDGSSYSESLTVDGKKIYVRSANDFAALRKLWNTYKGVKGSDGSGYDTYTIYLETDIDLKNHNFINWCIGWESDNEFGGHFDGQGHVIKNLYISGESANRALFGYLNGGNVYNLKIDGFNVVSGRGDESHVGVLCGRMVNHSTISHCAVVNGTLKGWNDYSNDDELGLICGYADGNCNEILYCYADGDVYGGTQVGGIVGKMNNDPSNSVIRYCYFSGTVHHAGNEYFAAIAGERYGNELLCNYYLQRNDGVKGTGNQSKYGGSSDDPNAAPKTEAELKAPLLFGEDNTEYIYPLDGYPELKVFLRYNPGDTFYTKDVGKLGGSAVPGYLKIVKNENSPFNVSLEKTMPTPSAADFTLNETFNPYFSDVQLSITGLGVKSLESVGSVDRVILPGSLDSIAVPQRHQVQNAFVLNNEHSGCAVKDNGLYDVNRKRFIAAPKTLSTLTIHQQYADKIADYAFENMTGLKTLYIDTYVPAGTTVDDGENPAPLIALEGDNTFSGCSSDLDIYVKDGTPNHLFLGKQGPGINYGYSNAEKWKEFYYDYEDKPNHMFTYFPVMRNAGGMSTLMLGYPVELPEGVTAWWASSLSDGNVILKKLGTQIVPALTPVLLTYEGKEPLYLARYTGDNAGAATDYEDNLFKGSIDPGDHTMTSSELMSNFFTLGRPTEDDTYDHLGFYQYHPKNNTLPSYVAWIANSDIPSGARFAMDFGNGTTLIKDMTLQPSLFAEKIVYTLQGVRINPSAMQKGKLYIVNGKKIILK